MPLTASSFVPKGPVKSLDLLQFYNLFTGVMTDQPVTFSNQVNIGGNQSATTVPLRLFGSPGQTSHLIDLYPDHTSAQPGFGFSAVGTFGWGPGGTAPIDTSLSRIATQAGHGSDTAGLLITPQLEITGNLIMHGSITFPSGGAVADGGAAVVNIGPYAAVQTNLYIGYDRAQWLHEVRAGEIGLMSKFLINNADAEAVGITFGNAQLQTRTPDMADVAGTYEFPFSAQCFAGNWLQFNPKFWKAVGGIGWPGIALLLDYDVDANGSAPGGRVSMINGRVGIGASLANPNADAVQLMGNATVNGVLSVGGGPNPNSGSAQLCFPNAVGAKICLYDSSPGNIFGMGINPSVMYLSIPQGATLEVLQNNSAGAVLLEVNETGMVVGPAAASSTVWLGTDNAMNWQRVGAAGAATMNLNGGGLTINGNYSLTWNTPTDPQNGGQQYRLIQPSSRPASSVGGGEVHIALRLYVDGDITAGSWMHAIGFLTTSDPRLKSGMTAFSDANCMNRIRAPSLPVYSYTIAPPISGGVPTPTPNDLGFDANDVYANSPEFVALDQNSHPVSVVYGNMAAVLWGALRQLDARCVAKGI